MVVEIADLEGAGAQVTVPTVGGLSVVRDASFAFHAERGLSGGLRHVHRASGSMDLAYEHGAEAGACPCHFAWRADHQGDWTFRADGFAAGSGVRLILALVDAAPPQALDGRT